VNRVLNAPGRDMFSVVDMSRQAPFVDAAKSIDETNLSNTFISYYTYGAALAFGLDLAIREHFPGKSLDDWMRVMWRNHPDINQPYNLQDLEDGLGEATGNPDFAHAIFQHHIYGREPLDYQSLAAAAGLKLQRAHAGKPWIGNDQTASSADGLKLEDAALIGSPLYKAGLDRGDTILKCDGKTVKEGEEFSSCVAKHHIGETLVLEYHSRAGAKKAAVTVAEDPKFEIVTFEKAGMPVSEQVQAFRQAWLSSKKLGAQSLQKDLADDVVIW
jgi:predicted metalloprotease with PDZ domain